MILRNARQPEDFSRWFAPFIAAAIRRANRKDLAVLKMLLERNAAQTHRLKPRLSQFAWKLPGVVPFSNMTVPTVRSKEEVKSC